MRIRAKICGLSTIETIEAAVACGASDIGFVFYPPSPRAVSFRQAERLAATTPDHVGRAGVFVDPDDALLDRAIAAARLDSLQLHATSPARSAAIARRGLPIWSAVAVRTRANLLQAHGLRGVAERIVFDAKTPAGTLPGGMGVRFDWGLLRGFSHELPWMLSGGLDAGNLAEAVRITGATMVDVSSGVESAPGVKDVDKIAAFLQVAREL